MNYDILIETLKVIVNEDAVYKEGLTLVYSMDKVTHQKLSEHFFYKLTDNLNNDYKYTEEFEIEIEGILIKFVINDDQI